MVLQAIQNAGHAYPQFPAKFEWHPLLTVNQMDERQVQELLEDYKLPSTDQEVHWNLNGLRFRTMEVRCSLIQ